MAGVATEKKKHSYYHLSPEERLARSALLQQGRYRIRAVHGRWDLMLVLPITHKRSNGRIESRLRKLQSFDTYMDAYHKAVELGESYATKMVTTTLEKLAYRMADAAAFATWRQTEAAAAAPSPPLQVAVQFTYEQVAAAAAAANALAG